MVEGLKGRRSIALSLNSKLYKVIGIKLTRESFSIGLYDISGIEYKVHTEPILAMTNPTTILKRMKSIVSDFTKVEEDIVAIGIAIPGPFLKNNEKIALITQFPGWESINFRDEFHKEFNVPVFMEHDANAAALSEWWFNNEKLENNVMVYLLVNDGVGAGIIEDGHLFVGSQGIAGEIGHMTIDFNGRKCSCGNYGCLECYCSTFALLNDTIQDLCNFEKSILNQTDNITVSDIFKAMDQGDPLAIKMIEQIGAYLGYGIVNIVNVYNPDLIVISGVMARGGEILLSKILETIKPRLVSSLYENVEIKLSEFTNDPILYGAAAIATDNFLKNPAIFLR